jgi:membrane protein DedA with SNARE-associated domain
MFLFQSFVKMFASPASAALPSVLNALGALVWAAAIGFGGYLFGCALQVYLRKVKHYEVRVFATIALLGIFIWIVHFYHRRKHTP